MEEEKLAIRVELVSIVESKLGVWLLSQMFFRMDMEVGPSKWDVGLSKTGEYTSYIMKYGIDWNISYII